MMENICKDPICCNPHRDTFLAKTEIRPLEPEVPSRTYVEEKKISRELIDALNNYKHIVFDVDSGDNIIDKTIEEEKGKQLNLK